MSRTIITKSGTEFWTNVNSEQMLGELCKDCNAKFYVENYPDRQYAKLAYSMTEEEADAAAKGLRNLAEITERLMIKYREYLGPDVTAEDFEQILLEYAGDFERSRGYECI
jgi:hypothetical protein